MKVEKDDVLYFDSENGLTYRVEIVSINEFRPPENKYAIDLIDPNGNSYYDAYGDFAFVGQDFIDKCRK